MTDTTSVRIAPAAEGPELTEHVNVLMSEQTRAFLLGSKIADSARSEGVVARTLLDTAVSTFRLAHTTEYERRVELGRAELAERAARRGA